MTTTISGKNARRAAAQLTQAHHLLVEAAALLGCEPKDGGLWDAIMLVLDEREVAGLLVDPEPTVITSDAPQFWV